MKDDDGVLSEESLKAFERIGRSREAWAGAASSPSPAHGDDGERLRAAARVHGIDRSGERLAARARADLAFEGARIRGELDQRLASAENYRQQLAERDARHRRLAAGVPGERVDVSPELAASLAQPDRPRGGSEQLADRARYALSADAKRDRQSRQPEVVGGEYDPDDHEAENAALGDATVVAKAPRTPGGGHS